MQRQTALLWSALHILNRRRYDAVREVYGSIDDASKHLGEELMRGLGMKDEGVREALMRLEEFNGDVYEAALKKNGVTLISMEDDAYPAQLRNDVDAPVFLTYKGDLSCLKQPLIALVGTREMSKYGQRVAGRFVPTLVAAGVVTVSGLAIGIDATVARETLREGGRTVAVLGSGLGMIHPPSNRPLAEDILEKGGLLLSEFPLQFHPTNYTFPARNRIIAGLSLATVVLEAPVGSGALMTADFALEGGKEVFLVPGDIFDPNYAGNHAYIMKGQGQLVTEPEEVLQAVGIIARGEASITSTFQPKTPEEQKVWDALTTLPQPIDDLVEGTEMKAAEIGGTLIVLELQGVVKNVGGGQWVRK